MTRETLSEIIGSIGQANQAAANNYMEALVRYCVLLDQKVTSLDLRWMELQGVIAENASLSCGMAHAGTPIPIS